MSITPSPILTAFHCPVHFAGSDPSHQSNPQSSPRSLRPCIVEKPLERVSDRFWLQKNSVVNSHLLQLFHSLSLGRRCACDVFSLIEGDQRCQDWYELKAGLRVQACLWAGGEKLGVCQPGNQLEYLTHVVGGKRSNVQLTSFASHVASRQVSPVMPSRHG